jgi:hypothetical protein
MDRLSQDEQSINERPITEPPINPAEYTHIIGVFRSREQADAAAEALKQANFADDCILVTDHQGERAEDARHIVHVMAPGEEQKAVGILAHHGANNSDIPAGTEIVNGDLAPSNSADSSRVQRPVVGGADAFPVPTELNEAR